MKNRLAQLVGMFTLIAVTLSAQQPGAPAAGAAPGQGQGRGGGRGANANAAPAVTNPNGVRIFIRAGLKSHAEGQHDYPQFLADWSKVLTERGARVDGGLHMPTAQQLAETDVVVFYKGDAGYLTDQEKADLDAFVKRGGGVVSLHDSLCGPDPVYFASIFGGAKKHGEQNFSQGDMKYVITDKADPIMQGLSDFTLPKDEAFKLMTWAPTGLHVLATVAMPTGTPEVIPQIWTYEHTVAGGQPARSFVWMQGHTYANFADPAIKEMLLRGISWAAKKPVDTLAKAVARQGGRGIGGSDIVVPGP
jgi:type 1 glutamine amidotransferase